MNIQKLKFRLRYYWRFVARGLGFCERCFSWLNFTRNGKGICPRCGR